jgi:predicted MFS family arabinose efflux permease
VRYAFLLAVGTFALGVNAYVMAGLLPVISEDLDVTLATAGQLVTVFTLCYAIAGPVFATVFSGKSTKVILAGALVVFILANVLGAVASSLPVLMVTRAIVGVGAGLYSPVASAAAVALAPPDRSGRALAIVLGGLSTGTVIGVPIGLLLAQQAGWRGTLWLVSGLGVVALAGVVGLLPSAPVTAQPTLRERATVLADRRVAGIVAVSFIAALAGLGLYTYLAPVLDAAGGIVDPTLYLWAWGAGCIVGSFGVGILIDRVGRSALLISVILIATAGTFVAIPLLASRHLLVMVPLVIWGILGFATPVPQQHRLIGIRPEHGAIVVALNASAIYLGSAVGAALGGLVLALGIAAPSLAYLAAALTVLAWLLHLATKGPGRPGARRRAARHIVPSTEGLSGHPGRPTRPLYLTPSGAARPRLDAVGSAARPDTPGRRSVRFLSM